jgi:hypothetical protein
LAVSKLNRKLLLPIAALIALIAKEIGGIELSDAQVNVLVEGILGVAAFIGLFMNPKASPARPKEPSISNQNLDRGGDSNE